MRMETCSSKAMARSRAKLRGMVSMVVHAVLDPLLFPLPLSSEYCLN
jgi:hypothetical protein